jgi:hypothetical protein
MPRERAPGGVLSPDLGGTRNTPSKATISRGIGLVGGLVRIRVQIADSAPVPPTKLARGHRAQQPEWSVGTGSSVASGGARVGAHLGEDALEPRLGVAVDVGHRGGDGGMDRGDLGVHLVRDRAVAGVAFAP